MALFEFLVAVALFIVNSSLIIAAEDDNSTLQLVHLIFRHGDRTNDAHTTYPKDPHKNATYYPYGLGQLTNKGRKTEFLLGKSLRERYNHFIGDVYTPNILDAVSTERDRAKTSLQLVLAGLFPPKATSLEWDSNLNWQPIPYKYLTFKSDHLLSLPHTYCLNYPALYQAYLNTPEGKKVEEKYSEVYPYVTENTGHDINSTSDIRYLLYFGLTTQSEWGFKLPPWTEKVYPEPLKNAVIDFYIQSSATPQLKRLSGGFLLKKILNDSRLKLSGNLIPQDRKLFLYSGHESNVAYLLNTLGVFFRHIPPYGACIMIEVHAIDGLHGIKILYEDYSGKEPKMLKVPGCDYFCPFDQLVELMKDNVPLNDNICEAEPEKQLKVEQQTMKIRD